MIVIGQPQHLGRRTLALFVSRRTSIGVICFIIAAVVYFIGPSLALGISGVASLGGGISHGVTATVSAAVSYISVLLFLASVILFLMGVIVALIQYQNYIFVLDEFSLKMRRGFLNHLEVSIPYRQIQDINLVRTLPHRMFGVSRLIMITAGHEEEKEHDETDTIFDPIDADLAEEIRTFLERRIGVQIIEGTVQADKEEKVDEHMTQSAEKTVENSSNSTQNHA